MPEREATRVIHAGTDADAAGLATKFIAGHNDASRGVVVGRGALVEPVRAQLAQRELVLPVQCSADDTLHGLQCVVESAAGTLLAGLDEVLARTAQSLETSLRTHADTDAVESNPHAERALP